MHSSAADGTSDPAALSAPMPSDHSLGKRRAGCVDSPLFVPRGTCLANLRYGPPGFARPACLSHHMAATSTTPRDSIKPVAVIGNASAAATRVHSGGPRNTR